MQRQIYLLVLLRLQNISTGFYFQHITLAEDDSLGYCVHCYNAIYIDNIPDYMNENPEIEEL